MEKDFHYYMTYALAKASGLEKPEVTAYASQFVDDNNEGQFVIDEQAVSFPEKLRANGGYYYPIMTQSLSPKSLDPYVQKYVYVPFHFLPGDNSVTINGKTNPLNTTPNSPNAQKVLAEALLTKNPYRIGIALHTVADTWSHQNFTGLREDWNAVHPWYDIFKAMVPNIGHAEAGHAPDIISETWTDFRTKERVSNKKRAFEAVATIYKALATSTGKAAPWTKIQKDFKAFTNETDYDTRIRNIVAYLEKNHGETVEKYDQNHWINDALDKTGDEVTMKPGFSETDWYAFHQAAKAHAALVMTLISGIL